MMSARTSGAVDAGEAMFYNADGLFFSIGTTFTTPYLPVAAMQRTTSSLSHFLTYPLSLNFQT
jgi:hypothetical protein